MLPIFIHHVGIHQWRSQNFRVVGAAIISLFITLEYKN